MSQPDSGRRSRRESQPWIVRLGVGAGSRSQAPEPRCSSIRVSGAERCQSSCPVPFDLRMSRRTAGRAASTKSRTTSQMPRSVPSRASFASASTALDWLTDDSSPGTADSMGAGRTPSALTLAGRVPSEERRATALWPNGLSARAEGPRGRRALIRSYLPCNSFPVFAAGWAAAAARGSADDSYSPGPRLTSSGPPAPLQRNAATDWRADGQAGSHLRAYGLLPARPSQAAPRPAPCMEAT